MALDRTQPCSQCGRHANRGVSIDAVVIRDGRILLIKRGSEPYRGMWALPGGYVEWDESVEDTVRREVKEETGLEVADMKLIGVFSRPCRHPKQTINIAYLVNADGEAKAGDDAADIDWFPFGELPELAFDHPDIIAAAGIK